MELIDNDGSLSRIVEDTIVGRSPSCSWVVDRQTVSSLHARLAFRDEQWWLRDLGSKNGTFLNGSRVETGTSLPINVGDSLQFGDAKLVWRVMDTSPPPLRASSPDGAGRCAADGVLALPDDVTPEALVLETAGGYVLERNGEHEPIADRDTVRVGGTTWEVRVPSMGFEHTETTGCGVLVELESCRFVFRVSSDEEQVTLEVVDKGRIVRVPSRAFTYVLLTLARFRQRDKLDGMAESLSGWRTREEVLSSLKTTAERFNLDLHRARRTLAARAIRGVDRLIERRSEVGTLRLGIADIAIDAAR